MSDNDREALQDFLKAIEDAQGDECTPSTEFYKLGRLAHRAANALHDNNNELTERQPVDRAIAALTEIESRMRRKQRGLRLEVIDRVLEFGRRFPADDDTQVVPSDRDRSGRPWRLQRRGRPYPTLELPYGQGWCRY